MPLKLKNAALTGRRRRSETRDPALRIALAYARQIMSGEVQALSVEQTALNRQATRAKMDSLILEAQNLVDQTSA